MRVPVAFLLLLLAHRTGLAQARDQGGYVTRLGNDTIAVERFLRTADQLEGERVLRVPETSVIRYVATIGTDGRVVRFTAERFDGAALDGPPAWSTTIEFGPDGPVATFSRGQKTETTRYRTAAEAVPMVMHSYALYEQLVRRARRVGASRVPVALVYPGNPDLGETDVVAMTDRTMAVNFFHDDYAQVRLDPEGRMEAFDARGTVLKVIATRVPELDAAALAREFAARDAAGTAAGPLSPRDTVRARVGRADLVVDYSRPGKRGRAIFGTLVPWGTVWRAGADAATQFSTSRDLVIGSTSIAKGRYTLWVLPKEGSAELIVNGETGQWGTDYHPEQDVARIPLAVSRLAEPVERFTIEVVPSGAGGRLRLAWDTTEWTVPVAAR
ncbi:MAG: DUF2911 domain-containing protein [Gemmatimonadales bacterium]